MPILPKLNLKAAVRLAPVSFTDSNDVENNVGDTLVTSTSSVVPPSSSLSSLSSSLSSSLHNRPISFSSSYDVEVDDDHPDDYCHDNDDDMINVDNYTTIKEPESSLKPINFEDDNILVDSSSDDIVEEVTHPPSPQPGFLYNNRSSSPQHPNNNIISSSSTSSGQHTPQTTTNVILPPTNSRQSFSDESCGSSEQNSIQHEFQFSEPDPPGSLALVSVQKKRRRTVNKLDSDPEKLPLCDLLFYNPPETIFQKENKAQNEGATSEDSHDENRPAGVKHRRTSNNGRGNKQSSPTPTKSLEDNNNNVESEVEVDDLNKKSSTVLVVDDVETLAKDDESSDTRIVGPAASEDNIDDVEEDSQEPLLTIDESGNIVLKNPASLNDANKNGKKPIPKMKSSTTYSSFRRRERSKNIWNTEETGNFYTALEIVGTDFSLMEAVFFKDRNRDRKQLKQKFKREEKINRAYIDEILYKSLRNRTKLSDYLLKGTTSVNDNNIQPPVLAAAAVAAAAVASSAVPPPLPVSSIL